MYDFDGFVQPDPKAAMDTAVAIMEEVCAEFEINVVGKAVRTFDGITSPPGFATCLLLDESHFSLHAYSDTGLLAADAFSCGDVNRSAKAAERFKTRLMTTFPHIRLVKELAVSRFGRVSP